MMRIATTTTAGILLVLAAATAGEAAVEVRLRERVVLKGAVVRLADVAEIVASDAEYAQRLGDLPLMPSPAPGTERYLRQRQVGDLLAASGVSMRDVVFAGAPQVAIVAPGDGWKRSLESDMAEESQPLNRHEALLTGKSIAPPATGSRDTTIDAARAAVLKDLVYRAIAAYMQQQHGGPVECRLTEEISQKHLSLLSAATTPLVCEGGHAPWTGRQRLMISFEASERAISIPVFADVQPPKVPVVVAVQPIGRGDVITAAHLDVRDLSMDPRANARRTWFDSTERLIGMEARTGIRVGDVVYSDQVQPRIVVRRGEVIEVSAYGGGIRVRTTATARDNGAKGDLVQVESLDTRERFDVRVTGPREAAVLTLTQPESNSRQGAKAPRELF